MTRKKKKTKPDIDTLDAMVEEATVDAHDEDEQIMGLFNAILDELDVPFETSVLGVTVEVVGVDQLPGGCIVATCKRGRQRQAIPITALPLPTPPPEGAEWIDAYLHWMGER